MLDTSIEYIEKQREILFAKTKSERFLIGADLINFGITILESNIKNKNPNISNLNLKIKVFKRNYKNIFSEEELKDIINSMTIYYKHKKYENK